MKILSGRFRLGQKTITCSRIDGVAYVDGKKLDDFIQTLSLEELMAFAELGEALAQGHYGSRQKFIDNHLAKDKKPSDPTASQDSDRNGVTS